MPQLLSAHLSKADPAVFDIIEKVGLSIQLCLMLSAEAFSSKLTLLQEKNRQKHFINLIPSENFTSQAVLDALGSVMQSRHSQWPISICILITDD